MKARSRGLAAVRSGMSKKEEHKPKELRSVKSVLPEALQEELARAPVIPGVAGGKWETIRNKGMEYLAVQKGRYDDLRSRRKSKLREVFIYLIFVGIFSYVAVVARDTSTAHFFKRGLYYYIEKKPMSADFVSNGIKDLSGVAVLGDYHDWLESVFLRQLRPYGDTASDGSPLPLTILGNNMIIGKVTIRQHRIVPRACEVPKPFQKMSINCYFGFTSRDEEKRDDPDGVWSSALYALSGSKNETLPPWFSYSPSMGANFVNSIFGSSYGTGGYKMVLDLKNSTNALRDLQLARAINWVDYNLTRAVICELSIYNPNVNMFVTAFYLLEFSSTQGVWGTAGYRVVNLYRFGRTSSLIDLVIEGIMFLFVIYLLLVECLHAYQQGFLYFTSGYNYLSVLNQVVFVAVLGMEIYTITQANSILSGTDPTALVDHDLHRMAYWTYQIYNLNAFNALLTWLRLTKYMDLLSSKTRQLSYTLAKSAGDVFIVLLIFICIFFGYSLAFHLAFGQDVTNFSTINQSLLGLFLTVLGNFSFSSLRDSNRILGPILFITYILVMVFCILNMFLTVIMKKYDEVAFELESSTDELPGHIRKMIIAQIKKTFRKKITSKSGGILARRGNIIAPMPSDEKTIPDEDEALEEQYLDDEELEEIYMCEAPRLQHLGITNAKQLKAIADVDMNGIVSISEIMNFQTNMAESGDGAEEEREDTYLIMKILERTNAIVSEEKSLLKLLEDSKPLATTHGGGGQFSASSSSSLVSGTQHIYSAGNTATLSGLFAQSRAASGANVSSAVPPKQFSGPAFTPTFSSTTNKSTGASVR